MPLKHASALDVVSLLNRLLADQVAAGAAGAPDAQQRVTIMADARSNSVLVRADNPGPSCARAPADRRARHAGPRGRQHVHRLPQECRSRARRADAPRDADRRGRRGPAVERLDAVAAGSADGRHPPGRRRSAVARDGAAATCAFHRRDILFRQRRDHHRRHGEQRARHHGARAGLQQSARDHRKARRPPRASVRRGADRRSVGRQGGRVRHPVAGAVRLQLDADAGDRRHELHARAAAATTSSTSRSTRVQWARDSRSA